MSKKRIAKNTATPKKEKSFFVSVFIGTLFSLVIGAVLLCLFSFIGLSLSDSAMWIPIFSIAALCITALSAGYLSAKSHLKNGLACGTLAGLFLIGILVLLVFAFDLHLKLSLFSVLAPAALVLSMIAGIAGVNKKAPKRKSHGKL